jgi:hypothetical protein
MPAATISSSNVLYTTASVPWTVSWNTPFAASAPYSLTISGDNGVGTVYSITSSTPTSGTVDVTGLTPGVSYVFTITATAYYATLGENVTDTETTSFTTLANAKYWNGSAWVSKSMKVWSGSDWIEKPVKVWNGSAWV